MCIIIHLIVRKVKYLIPKFFSNFSFSTIKTYFTDFQAPYFVFYYTFQCKAYKRVKKNHLHVEKIIFCYNSRKIKRQTIPTRRKSFQYIFAVVLTHTFSYKNFNLIFLMKNSLVSSTTPTFTHIQNTNLDFQMFSVHAKNQVLNLQRENMTLKLG